MKTSEIKIGKHTVGHNHPPFIIAEMSGNHNQSLDHALKLVEIAAQTGAHALKLQTYTADSLTIDYDKDEFFISDPESLWKGESLYQLYQKAHTPYEWHKPIFDKCKALGITCFSTPFDSKAVDFLEELDVPCYKIASFENVDLELIRKAASKRKPLIISTGMATLSDLEDAVRVARDAGCKDLILLKCTSNYPASPLDSNIRTIPHLESLFDVQVGLSDHTLGIGVAVASVALGATVIEKHFIDTRSAGGVDSAFSLEPDELKSLVIETERAWQSLGKITYGRTKKEDKSLVFRRSIYAIKDIKAGETFSADNVRVIRPGLGLQPKFLEFVIGKKSRGHLKRGTPIKINDID